MRRLVFVILLTFGLAGCNFNAQENVTPTADSVIEEPINPLPEASATPFDTDTPTPSLTPSSTPTDAPTEVAQLPTETFTPSELPTVAELATATRNYWEYVVQPGEQLIEIIQREPFNYRTLDVLNEIVRMNDNMYSADILPVGEAIRIPMPTQIPQATVDPNAQTNDVGVVSTSGTPVAGVASTSPLLPVRDNVFIPSDDCVYSVHTVVSGETAVSIVENPLYRRCLSLAIFAQINRDISVTGCNFEYPSGGENCNIFIAEGQQVQVLINAPTPTPSATPSGNETATPTPTYFAPMLQSPPEGAIVNGVVTLSWVSVGLLQADQVYVVTVRDLTASTIWNNGTRRTSIQLPAEMIPADGQAHEIIWLVSVGAQNENGDFYTIGGIGMEHRFNWNSH